MTLLMAAVSVLDWTVEDVADWLRSNGHEKYIKLLCESHCIDGKAFILLNETDLRSSPLNIQVLGDVKRLSSSLRRLQLDNQQAILNLGYDPATLLNVSGSSLISHHYYAAARPEGNPDPLLYMDPDHYHHHHYTPPLSEDGRATKLQPEVWKTLISLGYLFVVTWITAFVMVIVHDRVPDMKKYPPLPDIFLDNVPHIPWAFHMCELTGTLLLFIWLIVLTFHRHRFILLRRFFALSGTVFLLRCVTMLITSLSVPGTHLQCNPRTPDQDEWRKYGDLWSKIQHAYAIWRGAGMSIQGVRTCGDYMFSGHTVALTMLNFFITEYTPRHLYFLHTFTWLLNMFGIFFILAAHEHYSIDVFVAFYITSRLFLYYHTLANNQALMQRDSNRTRIWFPLFSFFESSVDGIVPNEYESPLVPLRKLLWWLKGRIGRFVMWGIYESHQRSRAPTRLKECKNK